MQTLFNDIVAEYVIELLQEGGALTIADTIK